EPAGATGRAAAPGDGVPAPNHAAPLGARQYRLRPEARRRAVARAPAPSAERARKRRPRARRQTFGARAFGRRAAAPGAGARVGAFARGFVSRRTDREPRSGRSRRGRAHHPGDPCRRHENRHEHAQPRTGAALRRRGAVPVSRPDQGTRAGGAFFHQSRLSGSRGVHQRRASVDIQRRRFLLAAALTALTFAAPLGAQEKSITVASTTSTEQSGLFGYLLPMFENQTGIKVKIVAVGTGQALDIGRRGDADVVFVHDPAAEKKFIDEGFGVNYRQVMYNDFVLIGPKADPAKAGGHDISAALAKIAAAKAPFVSRA